MIIINNIIKRIEACIVEGKKENEIKEYLRICGTVMFKKEGEKDIVYYPDKIIINNQFLKKNIKQNKPK